MNRAGENTPTLEIPRELLEADLRRYRERCAEVDQHRQGCRCQQCHWQWQHEEG